MKNKKSPFFILCATAIVVYTLNGCHPKGPYNPYLDLKVKPSQEIARKNNETAKKAGRAYKKQLRNSRKTVFGKKRPPKN